MRLLHRLIQLRYGIAPDTVLNPQASAGEATPSGSVAGELHRLMKTMKAEALDAERGRVNYARLDTSPTYAAYCACTPGLRALDPAQLGSREERLAFWINLYNALVVDAVIQFRVKASVDEVRGFFWRAAYAIGGRRYSAFDIEYGILRANRGHPAIPGAHFGPRDPRRRFSLDRLDPRIHFALVCAARSCPPIAVYDAERIDEQLDLAARAFVSGGGAEIDRERGEVRLSQIFQWYAPDFGGRPLAWGDKQPLLDFVGRYLPDSRGADRNYLQHGRPVVRFLKYDWALNQ